MKSISSFFRHSPDGRRNVCPLIRPWASSLWKGSLKKDHRGKRVYVGQQGHKVSRSHLYRPHLKAGSLDAVVTLSQSSSQGKAQIHFPEVKKKEHWPQIWKAYEPQKSPTCSGCPVYQPRTWEQEKLVSRCQWEPNDRMKICVTQCRLPIRPSTEGPGVLKAVFVKDAYYSLQHSTCLDSFKV